MFVGIMDMCKTISSWECLIYLANQKYVDISGVENIRWLQTAEMRLEM